MLVILFVGLIASGITARVTLLAHRGGIFLDAQARKSAGMVLFDLICTISGLAAFALSFVLFDWWWPLIGVAVGFWIAAPVLVTRSSFSFFFQTQAVTSLASLVCSLTICARFFEII
jgi:hypothetical protein